MFGCKDARRQAHLVVIRMHRNDCLGDDRPGIDVGAHEMHRAPGKAHAGGQRLPLRVKPREGRQQRGMNVDHPIAPSLDKTGVEDAHKASEANQVDPVPAQSRVSLRRKTYAITVRNHCARDASGGGPRQARGVRPVADDNGDLGGIGWIGARIDQRLQIRPASGDQHAQPHRHLDRGT